MSTSQVHVGAYIEVPRQKVFDFLSDPNRVPLVLPGLIENTNIPPLPIKVGDKFNYKYQMYGVVLDGEMRVTKTVSPEIYEAITTGGAESTWKYALTEEVKGTRVTLTIEYVHPKQFLQKAQQKIIEKLNQKSAEAFMENLKAALELQNE